MEIGEALTALGGEIGVLPALVILILGWAYWQKSKRCDELTERLFESNHQRVEEGIRREVSIEQSLRDITTLIGRSVS
ncbi:MAG: hypothetical protein ABNH26_08835 [Celeribacter sp.]|jgi:hypothetical protein